MKTITLVITLLCLSLSGIAQNNAKKEFEKKYGALVKEIMNVREQKDYKKAEKLTLPVLSSHMGLVASGQCRASMTHCLKHFRKEPGR